MGSYGSVAALLNSAFPDDDSSCWLDATKILSFDGFCVNWKSKQFVFLSLCSVIVYPTCVKCSHAGDKLQRHGTCQKTVTEVKSVTKDAER